MLVQQITTHVADAQARALSQDKNSPLFMGLIAALTGGTQNVENALFGIVDGREITGHPVGNQLDRLGELVGIGRMGLNDAQYLGILRAVIAQNFSDGTPDFLIQAVQTLYQCTAVFYADNNAPGDTLGDRPRTVVFLGIGDPTVDPSEYALLQNILLNCLPAGVGLASIVSFSATNSIAFKNSGTAPWVAGLADVNNPGLGGGVLASVIYSNPGM